MMRQVEAARWEVSLGRVGGSVHVSPARGLLGVNWDRYPRTAWGLRRAIRRCQRWCDRENRREDRARALLKTVKP
jgi:hypothetical protein